MSDVRIRTRDLCFCWPDGTPVLEGLDLALPAVRTGLVAPNGGGKSTLLRLLAGHLSPSAGTVQVHGRVGYLAQQEAGTGQGRVADALRIGAQLQALDAIEAGDPDPAWFERLDGAWDLRERAAAALARLGLEGVALERPLATLSGGQAMAVRLAGLWLAQPQVALLDEPSNHLDGPARQRLYALLREWPGCVLVASHDRILLEQVQQIQALEPGRNRLYGGGFGFYQASGQAEREAHEQQLRALDGELRRERRQQQQARERSERRSGNAARNLSAAGLSRIAAGNLKRSAQVAAGKSAGVHGQRLEQARERLALARQAQPQGAALDLELPATRVAGDRLLFHAEGLRVRQDGQWLFGRQGIALSIRGPERIELAGANGVGKSTLLQVLAGQRPADARQLRRSQAPVAYLSQRLELPEPALSLAEHFARATPQLSAGERALRLARLDFRGERTGLPLAALSGGERLRAVLACVLQGEPAPQLLLLDEPNNHLDLASLALLEQALRGYQGALVVVSHDEAFVQAIGISRRLRLDAEGLHEAG